MALEIEKVSLSPLQISVTYPVVITERDGYFVASCVPLDVHAEGDSKREARDRIHEALDVFTGTCLEMGTLDQVLREAGFTKASSAVSAKPVANEEMISVPFMLSAQDSGKQTRAY